MSTFTARHRSASLTWLLLAVVGISGLVAFPLLETEPPAAEVFVGSSSEPNAQFQIVGNTPSGLHPGGTRALLLSISNSTGQQLDIRTLDVVVADANPACRAANLVATNFRGHQFVNDGQSVVVPLELRMLDNAADACQAVTFPLQFTGTATKWGGTEYAMVLGGATDIPVCVGTNDGAVRRKGSCRSSNEVTRTVVRSGGPPLASGQLLRVCHDAKTGDLVSGDMSPTCPKDRAVRHDLTAQPLTVCVKITNDGLRADVPKKRCDTGFTP